MLHIEYTPDQSFLESQWYMGTITLWRERTRIRWTKWNHGTVDNHHYYHLVIQLFAVEVLAWVLSLKLLPARTFKFSRRSTGLGGGGGGGGECLRRGRNRHNMGIQ